MDGLISQLQKNPCQLLPKMVLQFIGLAFNNPYNIP